MKIYSTFNVIDLYNYYLEVHEDLMMSSFETREMDVPYSKPNSLKLDTHKIKKNTWVHFLLNNKFRL